MIRSLRTGVGVSPAIRRVRRGVADRWSCRPGFSWATSYLVRDSARDCQFPGKSVLGEREGAVPVRARVAVAAAFLLQANRQGRLGDAPLAATRHWPVEPHFQKGLAQASEEAISARGTPRRTSPFWMHSSSRWLAGRDACQSDAIAWKLHLTGGFGTFIGFSDCI
jgi:hypothetical protein